MALKSCSSSVHVTSLQDFENDLCEFNQRVEDLDRRLGTVFSQAFDDAPDLEHAFKVCAGGGGAAVLHSPPTLSTGGQGSSSHCFVPCREQLFLSVQ